MCCMVSPNNSHVQSFMQCIHLSVKEILEQVMVKNLDTGEAVPLSIAEEKLPKCTNPLALQIMRLTSEYSRYCERFLVMIQIPEIHFVVQDYRNFLFFLKTIGFCSRTILKETLKSS